MNNNKLNAVLTRLTQLDIDAVYAYEQALRNIEDINVYTKVNKFKNDYLQHVADLNALIRKNSGVEAEQAKDLKEYVIEGFSKLRHLIRGEGTQKTLEEHKIIEQQSVPKDALSLLVKNYNDEKAHLTYIKEVLSTLPKV